MHDHVMGTICHTHSYRGMCSWALTVWVALEFGFDPVVVSASSGTDQLQIAKAVIECICIDVVHLVFSNINVRQWCQGKVQRRDIKPWLKVRHCRPSRLLKVPKRSWSMQRSRISFLGVVDRSQSFTTWRTI